MTKEAQLRVKEEDTRLAVKAEEVKLAEKEPEMERLKPRQLELYYGKEHDGEFISWVCFVKVSQCTTTSINIYSNECPSFCSHDSSSDRTLNMLSIIIISMTRDYVGF